MTGKLKMVVETSWVERIQPIIIALLIGCMLGLLASKWIIFDHALSEAVKLKGIVIQGIAYDLKERL